MKLAASLVVSLDPAEEATMELVVSLLDPSVPPEESVAELAASLVPAEAVAELTSFVLAVVVAQLLRWSLRSLSGVPRACQQETLVLPCSQLPPALGPAPCQGAGLQAAHRSCWRSSP